MVVCGTYQKVCVSGPSVTLQATLPVGTARKVVRMKRVRVFMVFIETCDAPGEIRRDS